jgi:hypothetical protein
MSTFVYKRNIPAANNNPSTDQPDMRINTNSTDELINVDHVSFGKTDPHGDGNVDGTHRQVQLRYRTTNFPNTLGQGTIFAKTGSGAVGGDAVPFWAFAAPGFSPVQMLTRVANATLAASPNGAIPMMGGLIMQYGIILHTNPVGTPVVFPNAFRLNNVATDPYSIQLTYITPSAASPLSAINASSTGFSVRGPINNQLYWMAIGPFT